MRTHDMTAASHTPAWLPFGHLNLSRNPFGELTREERVAAAVVDVEELRSWVDDRHALQFIGDCGHGKTTHLLALLSMFSEAKYVYLPEDTRCPTIPDGSPLFIDEAQRLPLWRRFLVFRRNVPLVIGTHRDLSRPLRRAGYRVRTIDVAHGLTTTRLTSILNRRIELARIGPAIVPRIDDVVSGKLLARFGPNVRAMEHFLYERVQACSGDPRGEVRFSD